MKKLGTFIFLFNCTYILLSQSSAFGDVSIEMLASDKIEEFPDAEAVVLFDKGVSNFYEDEGFNIRFERTKRIKILKKSGYRWSDISIPYYTDGFGKTEVIRDIKAITYNIEDGRVVKTEVDPSTIFKEKINDFWSQLKFAFPQVKEGAIVEFRYTHETPFLFNLPDWEFQARIPTLSSEYEVAIIPYYNYVFIAQGLTHFDKNKNFQRKFKTIGSSHFEVELKENVFQFGKNNIPAFADEEFITSVDDYIMKIDFQLSSINLPNGGTREIMSTYPKLISEFLKSSSYGKFLKHAEKQTAGLVESLDLQNLPHLEKVKAIADFAKSEFIWDFRKRRFTYKSVKSLLEKRTGNSTEINLLLVGMLRNAGIEAYPVLLSSRDHGKIKSDYPFADFFNYTIAYVKTEVGALLLDATEDLLPFDRIPPRCFNDRGLIIEGKSEQWVDLSLPVMSNENNIITINVSEVETTATLVRSSTEYSSFDAKKRFKDNKASIIDSFSSSFEEITAIRTINYDNPNKQYIVALEGSVELEEIGNQLLIQPFLGLTIDKNPFTAKNRSYPIDMVYKTKKEYNSIVTLPESYKVAEIPSPYTLNNDLAEISLTISNTNNVVTCTAKFMLKKDLYHPGEYARIKHYYDQVVKYFNTPILAEKIE